jgi:hypothetical protein
MSKKRPLFYRKTVGYTDAGEAVTVICRMDRGRCDFVYAEVSGGFPGDAGPGIYDSSEYQYLVGASAKSLEQMGFLPI